MKLRKLLTTLLSIGTVIYAHAQCENITVGLSSTISTCQSNGTITVTLSGADVGNLRLNDAEYSLEQTDGSFTRPWAQAAGGILTGIPAGTYNVKVRAFCLNSSEWVVKSATTTATITSTYTIPNVYITPSMIRKSLPCKATGMVPINISGGRSVYTINITSYPAAYTGPITFSTSATGDYNVDNLAQGNYTFSVTDDCTYNTILTATVDTLASVVVPTAISYIFNPKLYPLSSIVPEDCNSVRIRNALNSSTYSYDELYYYYVTNPSHLEIAFLYNNTGVKVWQNITTSYIDYTLPVSIATFRASTANKLHVYIRIKGTNCEYKLPSLDVDRDLIPSVTYSELSCSTYSISHTPYSDYDGLYCYPYKWRVITISNSDTIEILPWSSDIGDRSPQTAANVPFGASLEFIDYEGFRWTASLRTPSISATYSSYPVCESTSAFQLYGDTIGNYIYLYMSYGQFPAGTNFKFISGPVTPVHTDYTTTAISNYFYPFSTSAIPTNQSTPYPYLPAGVYIFEVTRPGCNPVTVTVRPYMNYIKMPLTYTSTTSCDGMTIYPQGQLAYKQASTNGTIYEYNRTTYFSIESGPSGVTFDKTGVLAGEPLLLPATGAYKIKMTYSKSTGSTSYCAVRSITVNYVKTPLQLDAAVTSAYVCQGESVGHIRVKAKNGSGNYTYELRTIDDTFIASNSTGAFNYGSVGSTYTVKVIDNVCNTSFEQDVTMLDLSSAQIVYTENPSNTFCAGSELKLKCITLGTTTYSWTGPDGWTSNQQNPVRSNATPAMSGTYTVTVTPENCGSAMSQSITVLVVPVTAGTISSATYEVCENSSVSLTGTEATGGNATYSYQWQQSADSINWSNVGSNSTDFTSGGITAATWFRRIDYSCTSVDTSNVVKVGIFPYYNIRYPDIRVDACTIPSSGVIDLSKYLDTLGIQNIVWQKISGADINPDGTVARNDLADTGAGVYTYTVSNPCITYPSGKFYLRAINSDLQRRIADTVLICHSYADGLQINQLFGIDADGIISWSSEATPHISVSSTFGGSVTFAGSAAYDDPAIPVYIWHGMFVKKIEFTYTAAYTGCLTNETYKTVLLLTSDITPTVSSAPKKMLSLSFNSAINQMASTLTATINETDRTISVATQQWMPHADSLIATFTANGQVYVNGVLQTSGVTTNDFTKDVIYAVKAADGSYVNYRASVVSPQSSGLPVVKINIDGNTEITVKSDIYDSASVAVYDYRNPLYSFTKRSGIKGRGNSTWTYPKKPWRLKAPDKISMFGLPAEKSWVLLANYLDPTSLMNDVAFELARRFGLEFTHHSYHVELFMNGTYRGLYQLTEQVQSGKNRVNVKESAADGGYLVELDTYYDEEPKFTTTHLSMPIMVKTDVENTAHVDSIKASIQRFVTALFGDATFPNNNWKDLVDVNSLIDFLLVNEITRNAELYHPKSTYAYCKKKGDKIQWGPVWDFDWAFGYTGGSHNYYINVNDLLFGPAEPNPSSTSIGAIFFNRFFVDPVFRSLYKARWNALKNTQVASIITYIDTMAAKIRKSQAQNYQRWTNYTSAGKAFDTEIANMKAWLTARIAAIDTMINGF
jgi:hypothetical protein